MTVYNSDGVFFEIVMVQQANYFCLEDMDGSYLKFQTLLIVIYCAIGLQLFKFADLFVPCVCALLGWVIFVFGMRKGYWNQLLLE